MTTPTTSATLPARTGLLQPTLAGVVVPTSLHRDRRGDRECGRPCAVPCGLVDGADLTGPPLQNKGFLHGGDMFGLRGRLTMRASSH